MKRILAGVGLAMCLVTPVRAGHTPTRNEALLLLPNTAAGQRAAFTAQAQVAGADDPVAAGEAWYYVGQSWDRSSHADSALACYRRALALRSSADARIALSDRLLLSRSAADAREAYALLEPALIAAEAESDPNAVGYRARLAWADYLLGRPGEAMDRFAPVEEPLSRSVLWRFRMGAAALDAGSPKKAYTLLLPMAVASRAQDPDVLGLVRRAALEARLPADADEQVSKALQAHDRPERELVEQLAARRVRFTADDGFALGGVALAPVGKGKFPALVVVMPAADSLLAWDSLAVAVRAAGTAVILLEVRGSGWSVAPECPTPDTWQGRERLMQTRCAMDVRHALRALAHVASIDTARYAVCGAGATSPIALEAADRDPRVNAVLLLSPTVVPIERGPMIEILMRTQIPAFIQQAPEDFPQFGAYDAMYQAGNRAASRVAEARSGGSGAWPMRFDPASLQRLTQWMAEKKPARAKGGSRPTPPRPK